MNNKENLELRMYFFVPYNISEIQKGIQAGHASLEYSDEFGQTELFKDFVKNYKTWIILNGGTTRDGNTDDERGSMNNILETLKNTKEFYNSDFNFSIFREPDLNNTLTSICFIIDERVFNHKKYPFFFDYLKNIYINSVFYKNSIEEYKQYYKEDYSNWVKNIGGEFNVFLKEYLIGFKLA